jgi:hypothetical protein
VSYFGVRNPQHFQHDLEEIARLGFTSILFTFSEEDHRFYQGSLTELFRKPWRYFCSKARRPSRITPRRQERVWCATA